MKLTVSATSLNLRSEPEVRTTNRVAVLPHGQVVEKVAAASDPDWWEISTVIGGAEVTGFVAHRYLTPIAQTPPLSKVAGVVPVHLNENSPSAKRTLTSGRASPLGEAGRPKRAMSSAAKSKESLAKIVRYLDVENPRSQRYARVGGTTFCNIYACDYCYLSGAYLPRVWWTDTALIKLAKGETVPVRYAETVRELNANSLYEWLRDFGEHFGWKRVFTMDDLQAEANQGRVALICAQRVDLNRSGHICAVVPEENPPLVASRSADGEPIRLPLQSQAGAKNFCFSCGTSRWWAHSKFRAFGFWVHD